MIQLYDYVLSGSCYKVRLFLSIIGKEYEERPVDYYPGGEHRTPAFLELNPLGQIPVLTDGAVTLRDAQAILVYLAEKTASTMPDGAGIRRTLKPRVRSPCGCPSRAAN